jgi:ABC-type Mn2+/Zn2+ transport system ATPase subunit
MTRPLLVVHGLCASYGLQTVLRNVELECAAGEIVGIVGPNGAGKSTLLKALLGLIVPDQGTLRYAGAPLAKVRAAIAYMPQRCDIDWDYPILVREVVAMGCYRVRGVWCRREGNVGARVAEALRRVGVADLAQRQIGELSGGQRQRVLLARALVRASSLVMLDEPFAAVDAATETVLWRELARMRDEGKQVLVVHHDLESAATHFDRVLLLSREVVAFGAPAEVLTPQALAVAYGRASTASSLQSHPFAIRGNHPRVDHLPAARRAAR